MEVVELPRLPIDRLLELWELLDRIVAASPSGRIMRHVRECARSLTMDSVPHRKCVIKHSGAQDLLIFLLQAS